jgi:hypothetical protein
MDIHRAITQATVICGIAALAAIGVSLAPGPKPVPPPASRIGNVYTIAKPFLILPGKLDELTLESIEAVHTMSKRNPDAGERLLEWASRARL